MEYALLARLLYRAGVVDIVVLSFIKMEATMLSKTERGVYSNAVTENPDQDGEVNPVCQGCHKLGRTIDEIESRLVGMKDTITTMEALGGTPQLIVNVLHAQVVHLLRDMKGGKG